MYLLAGCLRQCRHTSPHMCSMRSVHPVHTHVSKPLRQRGEVGTLITAWTPHCFLPWSNQLHGMASQDPAQGPLTTQHIQQKLEENYDLLLKLIASNSKVLDPVAQAQADQWSKQLQENLMNLAGQADKSAAGQQSQSVAATAAQPSATPAAAAAGVAAAAQPTASTGSSVTYKA